MRIGFFILLACILALGLFTAGDVIASNETSDNSDSYPVQLGCENFNPAKPSGPLRDDPFDDWIEYDDGSPQTLIIRENYWSRVTFTPNAAFQLQAIYLLPYNPNNRDDYCTVRVYSEDQDSRDLDEVLWETEIDGLPGWNGADLDNWVELVFDEEDRLDIGGGEHFSIVYGPAPGGSINDNAPGWWNLFDGSTDVDRSFWVSGNNPPADHDTWEGGSLDGDLLVRANGEYQGDFIDIEVAGLWVENEKWIVYPETEQTFIAALNNLGDAVDVMVVSFQVYTRDDEPVWDEPVEMIIENVEAESSVEVTCESTFSSETAGQFYVEVIALVDDDSNPDNDSRSLEQIVFDPENEPDFWIGYCGDEPSGGGMAGDENTGWITAFGHPGGQDALMISGFRQFLIANSAIDISFRIATFTPDAQQYNWVWEGTQEYDPDGDGWVTVELDEDEMAETSIGEDQEIWVGYFYSGPGLQSDGNRPVSGANEFMPPTMYSTFDSGDRAGDAGSGDFMCQAKLIVSNVALEGALLEIAPDPVDFGSVNIGEEYFIEATFTAYGDQDVEISAMQLAGSGADYLSVDRSEFTIEAQSSETVTLRFYTDESVELESRIRVINNSDNLSNAYVWNVLASALSVDDYQVRLPDDHELMQNHPNPFNPITSIDFALKTAGMVNLSVYDMNGRQISEVVNGNMNAGYHTVEFNAVDLPAGIYIYRITAGDFTSVRKMILMK